MAASLAGVRGGGGNTAKSIRRRQLVFVALVLASVVISYADRTNMSIAIIPLGDEFGWSEKQRGLVLGSFFLGYLSTQALGGWLSDAGGGIGGARVLAAGVAGWSLWTVLTPLFVQRMRLGGAMAARIALGVAEGVGYPATHSMLPSRVPARWLNTAVAAANSVSYVGGALALLVSVPMAARWGWASIFYVFGGIGVLWLVPWIIFITFFDFCLQAEGAAAAAAGAKSPISPKQPAATTTTKKTGRRKILGHGAVWALLVCYYCNSWGFWQMYSWLPTLLQQRYQVQLHRLGMLSLLPYGMQGVTGMAAGIVGDRVLRAGLARKRTLRLGAQGLAMAGAAVAVLCLLLPVVGKAAAVVLLTAAMAVNALSTVGVGVNHLDLAPAHAGFLYGVLNSVGVLAGVIGVPLTGWILDRGSGGWAAVIAIMAVHYLVGIGVWARWGEFEEILR